MNIVSGRASRNKDEKHLPGADDGHRRASVAAGRQTAGRGAGGVFAVSRTGIRKSAATTRRCATGRIDAQTWCTRHQPQRGRVPGDLSYPALLGSLISPGCDRALSAAASGGAGEHYSA